MKLFIFVAITYSALFSPLSAAENMRQSIKHSEQFESIDKWLLADDIKLNNQNNLSESLNLEGDILFNGTDWKNAPYLVTKNTFKDSIVTFDFMLAKGSKAGLYLHGRYEINISDNYQQHELNYYDMGGLGQRGNGNKDEENYYGLAPSNNSTLAPGKWQTMEIAFRAPRFGETGKKSEQALFIEVKVNGIVVQKNTMPSGFTKGSIKPWEQLEAPTVLQANRGQIAIRHFTARRADFSNIIIPKSSGQQSNHTELVDYVKKGKDNFRNFGCIECHATGKNDKAIKSGPNLFGLFTLNARNREIVESGENHRFTIKANHSYIERSIRQPQSQLAVAETGNKKGEAFFPIMPAYKKQTLSDNDIDALAAYLQTLNDINNQGPIVKLIKKAGVEKYTPITDRFMYLVDNKTRIQRGPMTGLSGRSIHVGFPKGLNYSFDPRILAITKIWQGGFLDMSGEVQNRGGGGLKIGYNSQEIDLDMNNEHYLIAPLNKHGKLIDFSFKEAKFGDSETVIASLNNEQDHLVRLNAIDAQFLGYALSNTNNAHDIPSFNYRVGKNKLTINTDIKSSGDTTIIISGNINQVQTFSLNSRTLKNIKVNTGKIKNNQWHIPKGTTKAILHASITLSDKPWTSTPSTFNHEQQKLVVKKANAELPQGYSVESFMPPKDNYGREQLFEALGLAVAKNGTIVLSTRTAGIWRIVDGKWSQFAEGTFDSLGLVIEDDEGLVLTVGQKAELTRISDTNGDGKADNYTTLFDAFSYHGNYHAYMHGPVKADDGRYFVALNLAHNDFAYKAGGQYMGTTGGYRGWGFMVDETGNYEPWVSGLRSPAGLGKAPNGTLWYTENQGEFVGTSKLFMLNKNGFYGHPSGLVDLPEMNAASKEISWDQVKNTRKKASLLFPHNYLANSPGNIAWDDTKGKFGIFNQQMFLGDQTQSNLMRVVDHSSGDNKNGVAIPFASGLESGVMRPVFLNDGSMLVGQTGRGWQAKGGNVAALQRIIWDGKTTPTEIFDVETIANGFKITLSKEVIKSGLTVDDVEIKSWVYRDTPDYGSPELDQKQELIKSVELVNDNQSLIIQLQDITQVDVHPEQTARVYHIKLNRQTLFGDSSSRVMDAFYSLRAFK